MKQLDLPEDMKLAVDFEDDSLPSSARIFKPVVYRDGDAVCAVLGPDPTEGVFGCGTTEKEALKDWDNHLQERIAAPTEKDEVAQFILAKLNE